MKIPLELNVTENGTFLNFWNSYNGKDVVCQVKNGKLIEHKGDKEVEVTFNQFINKVKRRMKDVEREYRARSL